MKKHIDNYDVFKETISENNVLAMAEQLAMYETRFLIGYRGAKMQKTYADLCVDIRRKNDINHTYSDSYDLVQEGALFLCNHYCGKQTNRHFGRTAKIERKCNAREYKTVQSAVCAQLFCNAQGRA